MTVRGLAPDDPPTGEGPPRMVAIAETRITIRRGGVSGGCVSVHTSNNSSTDCHRRREAASDGESPIMNATATIAPASPQYMRALERANQVRLARAGLKRRIAAGEIAVADVLLDCPWEAASMAVADVLMSQRRWGQTRCRKFLAQIPMSEKKTIESMTDRQRQTLAAMLRSARVCSIPEIRATPERDPWLTDSLRRA